MSGWKHGEHPPCLPKPPEHHSVKEARELVMTRVRELLGAKLNPKAQREAREALREAVVDYDRRRDG